MLPFEAHIGHEDVLAHFPGFDYRRPVEPARVPMDRPDNITGAQQRAFNLWWALEQCGKTGEVGLEVGGGLIRTPWCLATDAYDTDDPPVYGGACRPQVVARGEDLSAFRDNAFSLVLANHVIEHLHGVDSTIVKILRGHWLRVLRPGGVLAAILPDHAFNDVFALDFDHKHAWAAADFERAIVRPLVDAKAAEVVEFDTLGNKFSFKVVLRKLEPAEELW